MCVLCVLQAITQPKHFECGFILLHLDPLARAIHESARLWVTSLGRYLNDSARTSLTELKGEIEVRKVGTSPPCTYVCMCVLCVCVYSVAVSTVAVTSLPVVYRGLYCT